MDAIKIIRGCGASGKSLAAGKVYKIPDYVSASDAKILIGSGKAVPVSLDKQEAGNRDKDMEKEKNKRKQT